MFVEHTKKSYHESSLTILEYFLPRPSNSQVKDKRKTLVLDYHVNTFNNLNTGLCFDLLCSLRGSKEFFEYAKADPAKGVYS